ncbi:hypothetical protein D2Q93_05410 [Alicyclobacillaceae bacterium I2511]|nr:hypothetical protein D2Q93_05410 [Alicyclobacillaceae bacterium I2511]
MTWDLWAAPIDSSSILTTRGVDLLKSGIQEFRKFFGEDFIDKCKGKEHPFLTYLMPGNDIRMVYLGLIDLFVHLQFLRTQRRFGQIRKTLRTNKSLFGCGHALLQLEVAGFALRQGHDIEFEPDLESGSKADLKVHTGDHPTVFEMVQMGTDHAFRATATFRDRLNRELMGLSMAHSLSIRGDILRIADESELTHLMGDLDTKARELNAVGKSFVIHSDLARLTLIKSERAGLPELSGPPTQSDDWARLEARISEKARQTSGAENVWIRIDGLSGLWYFTGWARHSLREKLRLIAPLCQAAIRRYDHVSGIVISNGRAWQTGQPEETVCVDGNFALRRHFIDGWERETIIIRRDKRSRKEVDFIMAWYAQEPSWLDWGLSQLGYPAVTEIFT